MRIRRVEGVPAVLLEGDARYLVVSDVHIGYEEELLRSGIHVPPQHPRITRKLLEIVRSHGPDVLVFLGDVKHRIAGMGWREAKQVKVLVGEVRREVSSIVITPGNHDVGVYSLVDGLAEISRSRGFSLGDAWLLHGHTWPPPEALENKIIVIGHTHPSISLRHSEGVVRRRVFLLAETSRRVLADYISQRPGYAEEVYSYSRRGRIKLLVMPHFNDAMPGVDLTSAERRRALSPILRGPFRLEDCEVIMLDGVSLGRLGRVAEVEQA